MLIKIVQNGIESDWFQLTKKAHRELIKIKPEAAIIHIEDVYPESPDAGRVIRLDFRLFTVLTREFKLEDLKQEKRDERHVEKLRLEARPANAPELASKTLDEQYIRQEIKDLLESAPALAGLTQTQLRRFQLFAENGKSFREIAKIEQCEYIPTLSWFLCVVISDAFSHCLTHLPFRSAPLRVSQQAPTGPASVWGCWRRRQTTRRASTICACPPSHILSVSHFYFLKNATTTAPGPAWVPITLPTVV